MLSFFLSFIAVGIAVSQNIVIDMELSDLMVHYVVYECLTDPCDISPINHASKETFVITTNKYNTCNINCYNNACNKQNYSLTIYSGCNNTIINCDNCKGLITKIGQLSTDDINTEILNKYPINMFNGIKNSAQINCNSESCNQLNTQFKGTFMDGVSVHSTGINGIHDSIIDCENIDGKCVFDCGNTPEYCIDNECMGTCDTNNIVTPIFPCM